MYFLAGYFQLKSCDFVAAKMRACTATGMAYCGRTEVITHFSSEIDLPLYLHGKLPYSAAR